MPRTNHLLTIAIASLATSAPALHADDNRRLTADDLNGLAWRSIGPANMGGRVAAIALSESDPKTFFIGYATGGIWKTTNNGTTFTPIFDHHETASIGSLAVVDAPPDWDGWDDDVSMQDRPEQGLARILWVGTGEGNGRNSSSWGHGVYRSTDGGASFDHLGLENTHDIPDLAVDPRDPDTCYIAALGHLWGPNEERGLYKTTDGGQSWDHVLAIDEDTGACEVEINPDDPDLVYAAMYTRRRTGWSFLPPDERGGIFRSTDAGQTWEELTEGLPERTGRIGIAICPDDTDRLYAIVESSEGGRVGDTWTNRSRSGGLFRSDDGGDTWERTSNFSPRNFYFSRVQTDPEDCNRVYLLGWQPYVSDDGGHTLYPIGNVMHVDFHAIVVDPNDPERILIGNDGGLYVSWDRGETWEWHNHMAVGQFYNVAVDDSEPYYRIGGGLQDNGSWIGPSHSPFQVPDDTSMGRGGAITNNDWKMIYFGDGFHVAFDPENENIIYAEWQGGQLGRVTLDPVEHRTLRPVAREGEPRRRFNWNAPFFLSPHDHTTLYLGGNMVYRMTDRGESYEIISPDLTHNRAEQITAQGSEAETYGTLTALAESTLHQGLLWAGSDDGRIHVTHDASTDDDAWTDVTPDVVNGMYVACIEPSAHQRERAYVAVDGHTSDDFEPILLRTDDLGNSWESIVGDLPTIVPANVIREDPHNPDVLYIGTEQAAYVTIDAGNHWVELAAESLPTVKVDDLKIQHREMDLVAGTHGRSIWILDDVSPISALTPDIVNADFHAFEPLPAKGHQHHMYGGLWDDRMFIAKNDPKGAYLHYWIRDYTGDNVSIAIKDEHGRVIRKLSGPARPGLNRVVWDLQPDPKQRLGNPHGQLEFVPPGRYKATLSVGEHSAQVTVEVVE